MRFAAIDFETASGARTSACSLGIAIVENGEIVQRREWLIRPPSLYFSASNIEVHGITPQMVEYAPTFDALWPEIEHEIGDRTLVAHNAGFDMSVLRATLAYYDVWYAAMPFLCSCSLSRRCWPGLEHHSLGALGREFGIDFRHHNAKEDAMVAARVVLLAAELYGAESAEELLALAQLRMGELSPGKYLSCRRISRPRKRAKLVYEPVSITD
jgi:DNA polymerase-3 subunit epsilon